MTPVEMLREAARLMRERAEGATPGPWTLWNRGVGWEIEELPQPHDGLTFEKADADHIAALDPTAALAIADWLDDAVSTIEAIHQSLDMDPPIDIGNNVIIQRSLRAAIATSHAYLRIEES